jgi:hypothetical protein
VLLLEIVILWLLALVVLKILVSAQGQQMAEIVILSIRLLSTVVAGKKVWAIRQVAQAEHIRVTAVEMAGQAAPQVAISKVQGAAAQAAIQVTAAMVDLRKPDQMDLEVAPAAEPDQLVPVAEEEAEA